MSLSIERVELLLLVAAVVALLARKLRLPYTVGLVAAGLGVALTGLPLEATLTRHLIFTAFLPPLIFEAALQMPWKGLKRDLPVTLTLATLGVLIAAAVVAVGTRYLLGWPWQAALLLGVLISATDPVSVIATFKEAGAAGRLCLLVEAESLFNDGTAAVLFAIALTLVGGNGAAAGLGNIGLDALLDFLVTVSGSVLCGAAVGGAALLLAGRTEDHLVEITVTTVAAFGSFLLAERAHLSGVLATLTAGVLVGNVGARGVLTERGRDSVLTFWEYAAFVANSLIFLLMGMPLAHQRFGPVLLPLAVVILLVLLGRAIAVFGCSALFARSATLRVPPEHQHILFWGGLRGALALALVLGLPETTPLRGLMTTVCFGVVAFSVVVQGITITPLLKRSGA